MSIPDDYSPANEVCRQLALIGELAQKDCSMAQLVEATALPEITIKRHITALRRDLAMDIPYIRTGGKGAQGAVGRYQLRDWGILSEDRLREWLAKQRK